MISEELKMYSHLKQFTFLDLKLPSVFGCVFKGWVKENGTAPVKPGTGLTAEITYLDNLLHPNLVKLVGYCIKDDQRLLVYEFKPQGSLENHLFRSKVPWSIRMRIALGAAKDLSFLHEEALKPVIYRDFKTSNILLDAFFTMEPLPANTSSLPRYPPSKELDAKLRNEEARNPRCISFLGNIEGACLLRFKCPHNLHTFKDLSKHNMLVI
ncbi:hypothetical protein Bca101_027718 [Brassica carinata]